jgi:hypothetical protein
MQSQITCGRDKERAPDERMFAHPCGLMSHDEQLVMRRREVLSRNGAGYRCAASASRSIFARRV